MASRTCSAAAAASSSVVAGRSTTNSSPPWRAIRSRERKLPRATLAICASTASPPSWPWTSLTSLKRSRSKITTELVPVPSMSLSLMDSTAASKPRRLCRPVNGSVCEALRNSVTRASLSRIRRSTSRMPLVARITTAVVSIRRIVTPANSPAKCMRDCWVSVSASSRVSRMCRSRSSFQASIRCS
ncbi:hypothetical protein D3C87_1641690 [compost metagenome]